MGYSLCGCKRVRHDLGIEQQSPCHSPQPLFFLPGLQVEFINPIFEFSRAMNELQLNDAEFALLIAISIFSAGAEEGQEGKPARDSNQRGLQAS